MKYESCTEKGIIAIALKANRLDPIRILMKAAGYTALFGFIIVLVSMTYTDASAGSKHSLSPDLRSSYTWSEGKAKKSAWMSTVEAEIRLKEEPGARENAGMAIKSAYPGATVISEHGSEINVRLPRPVDTRDHSARLKKIRGLTGIKTARPVFFSDAEGRPESKMVLTEYFIVQFPLKTTSKTVAKIETRYGLQRVKSFPYARNTFLYELNDPFLGISLSNELQISGSVNYAYPDWKRVRTKRALPDDPLFVNQWHLLNTGQGGGTPGEDVNIVSVWDMYMGSANEVIAIVDDGLETSHPDLEDNVLTDLCWDFIDKHSSTIDGDHGTSCAGVAAGRGFNTLGVCGAAPNARLVGHRILSTTIGISDSDLASSLSRNNSIIDIYSNSWGPDDGGYLLDGPSPLVLNAMSSSVTTGRGGRGNIYVWAGGNGGTSDNSNYDGFACSRYAIGVAASTNAGLQSSYSEKGANILVNSPSNGGTLGITTTDRSGVIGYNSGDYNPSFGGTSSATPLVAGIVALMLQANPDLTWRDVRNILASTAEKNNPGDSGWTTNGAGYHINHKYGFGRVDALAAVTAAQTWVNAGTELQISAASTPEKPIPDNNTSGVSDAITINDNITIEFVEVAFTAADHGYWPDLEVVLVSPDGTESFLAESHVPLHTPSGSFDSWKFGSVRHYGENSKGVWTLRVRDLSTDYSGTFQSWTLKIYGTEAPAEPTPSISGISISAITDSSATITWTTDQYSDSIAQYGSLNSTWGHYPSQAYSSGMATSHSLTITGLTDATPYYFRVGSTNATGNGPSNSPNETNPSAEFSFTTLTDAPTISGISAATTSSTATINWTTDEPADSVVHYGPAGATWDTYPRSVSSSTLTTEHHVTITGLSEGTAYYFMVGSADIAGNGPALNSNSTNPSMEYQTITKVSPPTVTGSPRIDLTANTIDISFSKANMQGVMVESNYRFSPGLAFRSQAPHISQLSWSTYRLYLSAIPRSTIYQMTLSNITDSGGRALSKKTFTLNDNNNNGMADDWETSYGITSSSADPDKDGLSNANEFKNGTLPSNADTDGDRLPDGWEVRYGLDPLDPSGENGAGGDLDHDGWTNIDEYSNNTDPVSETSPAAEPPDVVEVHPYDGAGTGSTQRIPGNASFAVRLYDKDGINIKDTGCVILTIDDGLNPAYSVSLADTDVVRTVKTSSDEDSRVSSLWVVYDRSLEGVLGLFPFGNTIVVTVEAKDRTGDWMQAHTYSFTVETRQDHDEALGASPATVGLEPGSSIFQDLYDTGFKVLSGALKGLMVVFSSAEPVKPELGPSDEVPLLNTDGVYAVGEVLNLQPPTVFSTPVRVFIPCPGYSDLSKVGIYLFNGSSWMLGCDGQGNLQAAGLGWMVEGSRVDHPDYSPPTVEIRLHHFSALQAGSSSQPDAQVEKSGGGGGGGGCFIHTASM